MNRELAFLRTFAAATAVGIVFVTSVAFKEIGKTRFSEIDVERINIVEKDGTVKMVITNVDRFPSKSDTINGRPTNDTRKQRAGMLFFNEDGIEAGGFIYDGKKNEQGHAAGLSLTYDQYDGDQVMQLKTTDQQVGNERFVTSSIAFIDQPKNSTQASTSAIFDELDSLRKVDPKAYQEKYALYVEQEKIGAVNRMMLGQTRSKSNGLYLFDDKGMIRGSLYIDKDNRAQLEFFDEKGNVVATFPETNNK